MMRRTALLLSLGLLVTGTTLLALPPAAAQTLGPVSHHESAVVAIDPTAASGTTVASLTDRGLALICELTSLQSLSIENAEISDAGIDALVVLRGLKSLDLYGTQITDRSLATIANSFPKLTSLELTATSVSDAGMVHVGKLTELEWLFLDQTRVVDEGISQLDQLSKLEHIYLTAANISNAGHQRFVRVHPQTSVRLK